MYDRLLNLTQRGCDRFFGLRRYPQPKDASAPKIIAHRGAWDTRRIENSMASFIEARRLGAWGVELDIHFTRDAVPVVNHDPDLNRCHAVSRRIGDLSRAELKDRVPGVCELADVLALEDLHFMIEVKTKLTSEHLQRVREQLSGLTPVRDYHILSLTPDLVRIESFLPAQAWILVGELQLGPWVSESVRSGLGGVAGHYLGMTRRCIETLHAGNQSAGVGFIPSKNLWRREWARGVDWVFTNTLSHLLI